MIRLSHRLHAGAARLRGFTLTELMVAVTIMGVLVGIGAQKFGTSIEQSRADFAAANLRAIWAAQRLYWLENHEYADLDSGNPTASPLYQTHLLDPAIFRSDGDYTYETYPDGTGGFSAVATRAAGAGWTGTLTITETGTVNGSLSASGTSATITPGFQ